MLVGSIQHARRIFDSIEKQWRRNPTRRYLVFDTETKAKRPFPKEDALTIGRAEIIIWSICYNGASYSFPTSKFRSKYPSMIEWAELLHDYFSDPTVTLVAHNWNYDANVCSDNAQLPTPKKLWCTYIGGWLAAEYQAKGLKDRAPLLGRFLRATKTVDFSNEGELAEYAEQDVVATEELYWLQRFGRIIRPRQLEFINALGDTVKTKNLFYRPPFAIEEQTLSPFERAWLSILEFPVLRATIRAEQRGFPFDFECLRSIRAEVSKAKKEALEKLFGVAGVRFNPNSGRDLTRVVDALGIEYPFKTKKGAPSFKEDKVQQMLHVHPFFRYLIDYKGLAKLVQVYIGSQLCNENYTSDCGLERWIRPETGAIHASAGTVEAVTGRGSSSRPNLQQIPSRRDRFGVRCVFVATAVPNPIDVLVPRFRVQRALSVLDYSQLELRIMCLISKDKAMTKVLCDRKGDIHQHTADEFGVSRDPHAKNLNFLLIYGGQAKMLSSELTRMNAPTDVATAQSYVLRHYEVYPRVREQREEWCNEHQRTGYIVMFLGRHRTLPDADWSNDYTKHRSETRLSNNAVQGTGQDFLKASIIRSDPCCINPDAEMLRRYSGLPKVHRLYLKDRVPVIEKYRKLFLRAQCKFLLQVHDEVIFSMVPSAAEECTKALADIMSWRHFFPGQSNYNIPLVAEGGVGSNWKAAKAKDAKCHVKLGYDHWEQYA